MISSLLFGSLPETARIGGRVCPINSGYRTMVAIEIEMFGENNEEQKLLNAFRLFYPEGVPKDKSAAADYLLWFHRCGAEKKEDGTGRRKARRSYCFIQDAPLIYAAFRQQYGINLKDTKNHELHWWEFSALFDALDEETRMAKVMYWRTCDLKGMSNEQRKFIKRMREVYAIREPESDLDSKTRLARRNAEMKEYVRKRMEECRR